MRRFSIALAGWLVWGTFQAVTAQQPAAPSAAELGKALQMGDPAERIKAADALAHMGAGAAAAVPDLITSLGHDNDDVRWHAARALGAIGAAAAPAVDALAERLKDISPVVRAQAAHALGSLGKASLPAVPALAQLVKDADGTVRRSALRALRTIRPGPEIGVPLFVEVLKSAEPHELVPAISTLAEAGEDSLPFLREAMKDPKARYWALLVIAEMGSTAKGALPSVIEALQDTDVETRREALLALAAMGPDAKDAAADVLKALSDGDASVKNAAAFAAGKIGPDAKGAAAELKKGLESADELHKTVCAWALTRVEPENAEFRKQAVALLAGRLADANARVRAAATNALAEMGSSDAAVIEALAQALADSDPNIAVVAAQGLERIGEPAVATLIKALDKPETVDFAVIALGHLGPAAKSAVPALAKLIAGGSVEARREATFALANIGADAQAVASDLAKLVADEQQDFAARLGATYALGKVTPASGDVRTAVIAALKGAIAAKESELQALAAWALIQVDPQGAETAKLTVAVLIPVLKHAEPLHRKGAAEALGRLGPAAAGSAAALAEAAQDEDPAVSAAAAEALKKVKP